MISVGKFVINSSIQIRNSIVSQSEKLVDNIKNITNVSAGDSIDLFVSELKQNKSHNKLGEFIGCGSYGEAYKINQFVVKYPRSYRSFSESWTNCYRTSRVLNSVNGTDYSRACKLVSGDTVLVSKYIFGTNVSEQEAVNFINGKGLSIYDAHIDGNVMRDNQNRLFLIDADFVVQTPLKRKNSVASDEFYNKYPQKLT